MSNPAKKQTENLPLWFESFAKEESKSVDVKTDVEALRRIAEVINSKRSVVVLHKGNPVKISNQDGQLVVEPVNPNYILSK